PVLDVEEDGQGHQADRDIAADVEVGPVGQLTRRVRNSLVGEAEHQGHHPGREGHDPQVVQVADGGCPPGGAGKHDRHDGQGRDPEGQVDVEDPVPADVVGDPATDEGPDD